MEISPGQVRMNSRYHLITRYDQKGVISGFGIAGRWTLKPVFRGGAGASRGWTGSIVGPTVTITVR